MTRAREDVVARWDIDDDALEAKVHARHFGA